MVLEFPNIENEKRIDANNRNTLWMDSGKIEVKIVMVMVSLKSTM